MIIAVPKETFPGERRVALVPAEIPRLAKKGHEVVIEAGAGIAAGYVDQAYTEKGARLAASRDEVFASGELIAQVRGLGANPDAGQADLARLDGSKTVVAFLDPLAQPDLAAKLASTGATAFSMELVPRITRAQSMDALSSQANLVGYKCVLLAADRLGRILPLMMTAAGTLVAARVLVIGAGVAGLQAIATAKRLGAQVYGYDVRPEVKDQVKSVGGEFVELDLDTGDAGDSGGYAKEQSDDFLRRQRELMAEHVRAADIVITTAAIPGRRAPVLVTREMLEGVKPGSILVDMAAETGGNCELTEAGTDVEVNGMIIMGPTNIASSVPFHASQLYARNVSALVAHLAGEDGKPAVDLDDEITASAIVCTGGSIANPRISSLLETSTEKSS
ncbi:MAG: NAD(P) transhydrogenase subunit alpha [Hyphomicrobiaceae bacterium]|jgi:NAD(P) transhydrogenase subunit alpha